MSVKQGNNTIAGGVVVDNTPTSGSSNAVSSGGVYAALSEKVNTGHEVIDFQEPTALNNYTWYRKYVDGWVEQGGYQTGNKTVTLLVEMANTNYETIINVLYNNSGGTIYSELGYATKTTTRFTKSGNATYFNWVVYGIAAN